jgi:hypothetical protein
MLTPAEMMLYSTMKLTAHAGGHEIGTGTGFFFAANAGEGRSIPLLVTNKHVIAGGERISAVCHSEDASNPGHPSRQFASCVIDISQGGVIDHPDPDVDLCAIPFAGIYNQARDNGAPVLFIHMNEGNVPSKDDWQNFDAVEEVFMVGCPRGIFDEANNLPIVRRGNTATPLNNDYNGKPEFMVDMACFPGSSGSPVFMNSRDGFLDRANNTYIMGQGRFFLLGILFAGPIIQNSGRIVLAKPPEITVASTMHLGYVIKSTRLLELAEQARARFSV